MKKETKALMGVGVGLCIAVISHLVHTEPIAKTKESFKFAVVKDWSETVKGPKLAYLDHLYKSAE
jgi:hypothetical protein